MVGWLLGAFLAFVKAPGGPHCPTAVLLFGKARKRFAALGPNGFLEASAELCLSSHGIHVWNDLLVGVRGMYCLGLLDGVPLVRDLGLAWLSFFHLLARWAVNSGNLVYLDRSLRRMLHVDIDYVGGKFHFDSLLVSHGQRQGVCGMDDMRSQGLPWLLGVLVEFRPTGTKDGDLAKLSCEIWRALAFVP